MSFYTQLSQLIAKCNAYQKTVEENELWFTKPYQSTYLDISKIISIYNNSKIEIESVAAGEQSAPGLPSLTPARKEYYDLEAKVPPFLAGEHLWFYYLQTYKIRIIHLLKTFSYSTFKGDWAKMRILKTWLAAIENAQEAHDAEGSIKKSLEDIKDMGDFSKLNATQIQLLQEEVHNIQTLLAENPALEESLTAEDAELLKSAAEFVQENEHQLIDLPEIDNSFVYVETPVLETIARRCKQLLALVDEFPDECEKGTHVTELFDFKQALGDSFNDTIGICNDIHTAIIKEIGSHKKPSIKALCKMLHRVFEPFSDEDYLAKHYEKGVAASTLEVERGIPDTLDFEMLLLVAVGEV